MKRKLWLRIVLATVVLVAVTTMSLAADDGSRSAAKLRTPTKLWATLTASELVPAHHAKAPRATGVFVGTLDGRTLRWRLTFRDLSSPSSVAHLHLGRRGEAGVVAMRLCSPCRSGVARKSTLTKATVKSLRQRSAYVDLHTRQNRRGEIRGQIALGVAPAPEIVPPNDSVGVVPTLRISAPNDGATITPPSEIRYAVSGFELGAEAGHMLAFVRGVVDPIYLQLELTGQSGVAILPADKLFTGRRDLTFVLARPDGTLLENPEARVTVYGLTIQGGRPG